MKFKAFILCENGKDVFAIRTTSKIGAWKLLKPFHTISWKQFSKDCYVANANTIPPLTDSVWKRADNIETHQWEQIA